MFEPIFRAYIVVKYKIFDRSAYYLDFLWARTEIY